MVNFKILKIHIFLFILIIICSNHSLQATSPKDTNYCSSSPCRSPSKCENIPNGYVCHCRPGVRGKKCERILVQYENLCGSNPCWNGGTCVSNATSWECICPLGKAGKNCKDFENKDDYVIKILNKGWYVAKMTLIYRREFSNGEIIRLGDSIPIGKDYTFKMPYDADLSSSFLVVHAVGGVQVFNLKIEKKQDCFHVYGTTLLPKYSRMPCW